MIVPAGRINKRFGTEGGVMLSLYPAFPDDFAVDTPLFVRIDGLDVPLYCDRFERRGMAGAVAAFADFDTERRAQELVGLEFGIADEEEGDDDEFFLEDLIGFAAEVEELVAEPASKEEHPARRCVAGRLTDYYDSEANPLFELEIGGAACWCPPSRSSSPASISRAARSVSSCPKGCSNCSVWHAWS